MKYFLILLLFLNAFFVPAQNLTGVKIFINPGHGGFDSDDRNVVIAPYSTGDKNGFWESQSNLDKGFALRTMLQSSGATVAMSRTSNTTADDLPLSQIVTMGNTMQADFFLSIHSNAGSGVANHVLMIHYGSDLSDSQIYNTYNPGNTTQFALSNESRDISTEIAKNLYANQITCWSSAYQVRGDKTFARTIMGWSDGYGVLRGLAVPGVISEGAMHDYIPETYRLMNMEYKWLEAWNFYKSFCNYFNGGQITTGVIAGQVRDSRIKNEATYNKFTGNDQMLPLNGAKLTLIETNETYTVDNMQNGVFVFKNLVPGIYHIKAEKDGYYAQTVEITVTAHNISYKNFGLNRVRNTPPQVLSYAPNVLLTDSVEASTSITLQFNWDMDTQSTEQAFSISPAVAGKLSWEDTNYRLRFTPDKPLNSNTVYTVTLNKSASHPDNQSMTADFSFQFRTKNRNRLSLIAVYPFDGNDRVYYNSPTFRLVFDKRLNSANLATTVKVLDETNAIQAKATRSVSNNSIIAPYGSHYFNLASNLLPDKEYTLVIDGEVVDEVGVKVVEPINIKFKTAKTLPANQQVVNTFDNLSLDFDANQSDKTLSAVVSSSSTALFGTASNKISVTNFALNDYAYFNFNESYLVNASSQLGWYINGDLSGCSIEIRCKAESDERYIKLCDLNFYGWEYQTLNLNSLAENKTYELTGIRIKRISPWIFNSSTNVLFDNLVIQDNGASAVHNPLDIVLKIYPNPATNIVMTDIPKSQIITFGLYSLNGVLLKQTNENKIDVSAFKTGTYILKLKTENNQFVCPLLINR